MTKVTTPHFFVRHQGRFVRIAVAEIQYIEARKNYSRIVTTRESYLVLVPLKRFETALPTDGFCRIHRAFIVALSWINSFDNDTVYGPDQTLPIGETYRDHLQGHLSVVQAPSNRPVTTELV